MLVTQEDVELLLLDLSLRGCDCTTLRNELQILAALIQMRQVPIFQLHSAAAGTVFNPAMRIGDQCSAPLFERLADGAAGDELAVEPFQQDPRGFDVYRVAHGDDAPHTRFDQPRGDSTENGEFADR